VCGCFPSHTTLYSSGAVQDLIRAAAFVHLQHLSCNNNNNNKNDSYCCKKAIQYHVVSSS
jgi:hypothetical protein